MRNNTCACAHTHTHRVDFDVLLSHKMLCVLKLSLGRVERGSLYNREPEKEDRPKKDFLGFEERLHHTFLQDWTFSFHMNTNQYIQALDRGKHHPLEEMLNGALLFRLSLMCNNCGSWWLRGF